MILKQAKSYLVLDELKSFGEEKMKLIKRLGRLLRGLLDIVLYHPQLVRVRGPEKPPEYIREFEQGRYYSDPFKF